MVFFANLNIVWCKCAFNSMFSSRLQDRSYQWLYT